MAHARDGTAYDLTGPKDAPCVVLIHGLGLSRRVTWDAFVPRLSDRFRVLSYDLPGHGKSAPVAGEITLTRLSAQLIGLMDELGLARAALIGFSLGGMINRRVAMDNPDRVQALAILNSPHERDAERQRLMEEAARQSAEGGPAATLDAALERWFTPEFRATETETVARVRETVLACEPASYAAHRYVLAAGVTELIRPDPPIPHPALVMTCEHDPGSTPAMSRAIGSEMPRAEVRIVPGLRHLGLIEAPQAFLDPVLAFIDRLE
ncbi:alpha/beta fold hydrolase [Roseovarius aestuariivivens]|uniref:alpha/beta fold hydrolase n=1 Tax=Roseovarius aestuariivivens TaxID=1888910 RepID=UPI00108014D3|nr:alpha/beta fold hydrolase [Roseovarius aestuariivivens]